MGIQAYNSYIWDFTSVDFKSNTITNNSFYGVALINSSPTMKDNIMSNNWKGMFGIGGSQPVLYSNDVSSNSVHGMVFSSSSMPSFMYYSNYYDFGGCNNISYNGGDGVYANGSSYPQMGWSASMPGNNTIHDNGGFEISNHNSGSQSIWAKYNWWNSTKGPSGSDFYRYVSYLPFLQSPPGCGTSQVMSGDPPGTENTPSNFNILGIELYDQGQINSAIQMFAHVVNHFPDTEEARFALQQIINLMYELRQEEQIFPFLLELSSNNLGNSIGWYAVLHQAFILDRIDNHAKAVQLIESILPHTASEPDIWYPTVLYGAMILANGLNQDSLAVEAFTEFLANNPPEDLAIIAEVELEQLTGIPPGLGKKASEQKTDILLPLDSSSKCLPVRQTGNI